MNQGVPQSMGSMGSMGSHMSSSSSTSQSSTVINKTYEVFSSVKSSVADGASYLGQAAGLSQQKKGGALNNPTMYLNGSSYPSSYNPPISSQSISSEQYQHSSYSQQSSSSSYSNTK